MTMPLSRLAELLAAYGAEPSRWPEHEREAAQALLAASPEARTRLARERRLDALLDGYDTPPLPAGLPARVLRGAPVPAASPWRRFLDELGGWRLLAPGLAAALAIGVGVGSWVPQGESTLTADSADLDVLALARLDEEADAELTTLEIDP